MNEIRERAWKIIMRGVYSTCLEEAYIISAHIPLNKIAFMTVYNACTFLSQLELSLGSGIQLLYQKKKDKGLVDLTVSTTLYEYPFYNFVLTCFMTLNIVNFHENYRYARKYCIYDSFYLIILVNYVNLNCHIFSEIFYISKI